MDRKKAARRSCHYERARRSTIQMDEASITRAQLYGGVIIAVSFGMMLIHAAVV
jgi:hypothetical protein